jgi:hypothetical protein
MIHRPGYIQHAYNVCTQWSEIQNITRIYQGWMTLTTFHNILKVKSWSSITIATNAIVDISRPLGPFKGQSVNYVGSIVSGIWPFKDSTNGQFDLIQSWKTFISDMRLVQNRAHNILKVKSWSSITIATNVIVDLSWHLVTFGDLCDYSKVRSWSGISFLTNALVDLCWPLLTFADLTWPTFGHGQVGQVSTLRDH